MSGNRSLDEFADAGAGEGSGAGEAVEGDAPGAGGTVEGASPGEGGAPPTEPTVDGDGVEDAARAGGGHGDGEAALGEPPLDPPASTYVWQPDGEACDGCGATVDERWRDGDDLVCSDCKEW